VSIDSAVVDTGGIQQPGRRGENASRSCAAACPRCMVGVSIPGLDPWASERVAASCGVCGPSPSPPIEPKPCEGPDCCLAGGVARRCDRRRSVH